MKLLRGVRVLELDGPFGSSCARFLGSLGAEVIKVVAPGGRDDDPIAALEDADKQRVTLDLGRPEDVDALRGLAARADFLVESAPVGALRALALDYPALSALNPRLIHASITAFGSSGPYAAYRGSELVASAMGGVLRERASRDGAPVKEALDACTFHAAAVAAAAMLLAFHELRRSGRGQHVDVSLYEVTASRSARSLLRWQFARAEALGEAAEERPARAAAAGGPGALLRWLRAALEDDAFEAGDAAASRSPTDAPDRALPARFLKVTRPAPRAQWTAPWTPRSRALRGPASGFAWDVQRGAPRCGALTGVKVLDLSTGVASALASKALAEHGAQVVRLESSARPPDDAPWRAYLDTSKLSLRMHLAHPQAREVLEPLLDWADVLIESEAGGPAELEGSGALALDGASAHARRAELVVVRARSHPAALAGRALLDPEGQRTGSAPQVAYDDAITAPFVVAGVAAALAQRRRTGLGCRVDASAYALCAHQLAPVLLAAQADGAALPRGNADARVLAQGVYPARGSDRWIAITLFDAQDLARLAALTGSELPAAAALRDDAAARAALDARIAAFSCARDDHALMQALQAQGIAAGVVQGPEDLLARDRHLTERGALVKLTHPQLGRFVHQASPYPLGSSPASLRTAPLPGEHTEYVCRELLGLDAEHVSALRAAALFF